MKLNEVRQLISRSNPTLDWNTVEGGPLFLNQFTMYRKSREPGEDTVIEVEGHYLRAAYVDDVSIGIAYGIRYDDSADDWTEVWAKFPDPKITGYWGDVLYNGMLIDRVLLLAVDGGRAMLPAPSPVVEEVEPGKYATLGFTVTQWEHDFARVADGLRGRSEFDSYFERAGIEIKG